MSIALIASLVLSPSIATKAEVVFTARFYYPPGDKRVSHTQVYTSKLDGSMRRQLSSGTKEIWSVRWAGPNHVAWIEGDTTIAIYSLVQSKVVKRIRHSKGIDFFDSAERGVPRPWGDGRAMTPNGSADNRPEQDTRTLWEPGEMRLDSGNTISWNAGSYDPDGWKYRLDGNDMRVKIEGQTSRIFRGSKQFAFLQTFEGGGSAGNEDRLYSFDPANARARLLIDKIDSLDFDPKSRYWSGIEPWRPLVAYGKGKTVWANQIYVGDLKTGKRWLIAKGLVLGQSVQIRPGI